MTEVYKLLTGKEQVDHKQYFTLADRPYDLRGHEKKLAKGRSRLDSRKFFFSQRVVNGWNGLPAKVVNTESVNSFKNAYDREGNGLYSVNTAHYLRRRPVFQFSNSFLF